MRLISPKAMPTLRSCTPAKKHLTVTLNIPDWFLNSSYSQWRDTWEFRGSGGVHSARVHACLCWGFQSPFESKLKGTYSIALSNKLYFQP
jgi:hypothetical protein